MKHLLPLFLAFLLGGTLPAQEIDAQYRPLITKRTADWCPNCGSWGWTFFHWLLEDNDDKAVIWAAHHSGSLATPASGAIADNFGGFSQPIFYLDETDLEVTSSNMGQKRMEVAQQVAVMAQQVPPAGLGMEAWIEDEVLHVNTRAEMLHEVQGTWRLGLYLVEKEHLAPQAGQSGEAVHKRLLRTAITDDIFGEVLTENGAQPGEVFSFTASLPLTDPNWTADNLIVVAVLWAAAGDHFVPRNAAQTDDFSMPTATTEVASEKWTIWPNPVGEVVRVRGPRPAAAGRVRMLDVWGRAVAAPVRSTGEGFAIDVRHLPEGMYVLEWEQDGRRMSRRVVVAR